MLLYPQVVWASCWAPLPSLTVYAYQSSPLDAAQTLSHAFATPKPWRRFKLNALQHHLRLGTWLLFGEIGEEATGPNYDKGQEHH